MAYGVKLRPNRPRTRTGVPVCRWFRPQDRERTLDSPTDKLLMHVAAFADELEREKARQRTFDAMIRAPSSVREILGGTALQAAWTRP